MSKSRRATEIMLTRINNDQWLYNHANEIAVECWCQAQETDCFTRYEAATLKLRDRLKSYFQSSMPDLPCEDQMLQQLDGTWSSMLRFAEELIDWGVIAKDLLQNIPACQEDTSIEELIEDEGVQNA